MGFTAHKKDVLHPQRAAAQGHEKVPEKRQKPVNNFWKKTNSSGRRHWHKHNILHSHRQNNTSSSFISDLSVSSGSFLTFPVQKSLCHPGTLGTERKIKSPGRLGWVRQLLVEPGKGRCCSHPQLELKENTDFTIILLRVMRTEAQTPLPSLGSTADP